MAPAELVVMCLFGEKVRGWGAIHGVRGSAIAVQLQCATVLCLCVLSSIII